MSIKSVVFDMDGTLLNTMDMIVKCNNYVLESEGYPQRKYEEFFSFVGDGMKKCVTRALPEGADEKTIKNVLLKVLEKYNGEDVTAIKPYDGIDELLKGLVSRGVKISILTNKQHDYALINADVCLAPHKFEIVIGDRPQTPLKPDPAGLLEIIKFIGFTKEETLFVGDMKADILTGKNAGVKTVGCLWGFGEKEDLIDNGADFLVSHPSEILELI